MDFINLMSSFQPPDTFESHSDWFWKLSQMLFPRASITLFHIYFNLIIRKAFLGTCSASQKAFHHTSHIRISTFTDFGALQYKNIKIMLLTIIWRGSELGFWLKRERDAVHKSGEKLITSQICSRLIF